MVGSLTLTAAQWQLITEHLDAGLPNEACGLLAGRDGRTHKVYLTSNALHSPVRYEVEPGELIRAIIEIEEGGWDVIGIFHSHPAGPPTPSPTDVAEAYYPDSAYMICSAQGEGWQARAFEIRDGVAREIEFVIESSNAG